MHATWRTHPEALGGRGWRRGRRFELVTLYTLRADPPSWRGITRRCRTVHNSVIFVRLPLRGTQRVSPCHVSISDDVVWLLILLAANLRQHPDDPYSIHLKRTWTRCHPFRSHCTWLTLLSITTASALNTSPTVITLLSPLTTPLRRWPGLTRSGGNRFIMVFLQSRKSRCLLQ